MPVRTASLIMLTMVAVIGAVVVAVLGWGYWHAERV
jgi:hypothetical protein